MRKASLHLAHLLLLLLCQPCAALKPACRSACHPAQQSQDAQLLA